MNMITTAGNIVPDQTSNVNAINDSEVFMMDPRKLSPLAALNPSMRSFMKGGDDILVDSIIANGFDRTRPLMGAWTEVADGVQEVRIIDGARRLRAVLAAIEKGADIALIPVRIAPGSLGNPDDYSRAYTELNSLKIAG
jgi:hypothetical protein